MNDSSFEKFGYKEIVEALKNCSEETQREVCEQIKKVYSKS